jgi:predicted AlkP superfamily pyrophosphatase or phosphodiesterase
VRGRLLAACLALVAAPLAAAGEPAPTVILVSWDGVRHDHPDRAELPALRRMEREGARVERLTPPFPSNTFPGHVTLATGTHPDRHGIIDNRFLDPEDGEFDYDADARWLEAEPLWVAAERQGVRSAVLFWVGSETDWNGVSASQRVAPFDASLGEDAKVDRLLAWLDLPEPDRPHLLLSWWHGADREGHRVGPDHPAVAEALAGQDAALARLLAGLDAREAWPHTTLFVVSDHGMARAGPAHDAEAVLAAAGLAARVATGGGSAQIYLEDPRAVEAARAALDALPGVDAFARDALPERLRARHRRSGDVVALASPPTRFARSGGGSWWARWVQRLRPSAGIHGYDPALPEMAGVLLAMGRGVPAGRRLPAVHAVDVAPTAAALLGIDPPRSSEGAAFLPIEAAPR